MTVDRTFVERFQGMPLNIGRLSRLVPPKEAKATKEGLKDGQPVSGLGDHVTIRSGESKLVVTRGRIAAVGGEDAAL